jgi:glutamate-1-semialdehyde aminotransferase
MKTNLRNRARSRELFARAQRSLVEGVNSPSRGLAVHGDSLVMLERGQAPKFGTPMIISTPIL